MSQLDTQDNYLELHTAAEELLKLLDRTPQRYLSEEVIVAMNDLRNTMRQCDGGSCPIRIEKDTEALITHLALTHQTSAPSDVIASVNNLNGEISKLRKPSII
jgi:hypothetical protein